MKIARRTAALLVALAAVALTSGCDQPTIPKTPVSVAQLTGTWSGDTCRSKVEFAADRTFTFVDVPVPTDGTSAEYSRPENGTGRWHLGQASSDQPPGVSMVVTKDNLQVDMDIMLDSQGRLTLKYVIGSPSDGHECNYSKQI